MTIKIVFKRKFFVSRPVDDYGKHYESPHLTYIPIPETSELCTDLMFNKLPNNEMEREIVFINDNDFSIQMDRGQGIDFVSNGEYTIRIVYCPMCGEKIEWSVVD